MTQQNTKMESSTEEQLPVSNNLLKVEFVHVLPENMLNEKVKTLIMASIKLLKHLNCLIIHLKKNFEG